MEEEDAGVRKRKRDGEAGAGVVSGEAGDGGGYCDYEKELGEEVEEEEYVGIAEESVEEVMRWLEMEISLAAASSAPENVDAEGFGFVTINGNEESCGPSFSAAASTVMASVDARAGALKPQPSAIPWPWPPAPEAGAARGDHEQAAMAADVAAELDVDEEWLEELLSGGPALEGLTFN